jgi:TolB-like protein
VDGRGDLYALGILLFEMLTGELPFPGCGSGAEAMTQRLSGASRDLRTLRGDVPSWLTAIVRRLLQRDANHRFQNAREVVDALDGIDRLPRLPLRQVAAVLTLPVMLTVGWAYMRGEPLSRSPMVAASPAAPVHTVAVLPLADETGRPDLAWLSHGLAEMIANDLGESPALRVVPSSRVFQTAHDLGISDGQTGSDLRRLAGPLDADRLIAGRIWAAGGHLRAILRVVSTQDGSTTIAVQAEAENDFDLAGMLGRELREHLAAEPPAAKPVAASAQGSSPSW